MKLFLIKQQEMLTVFPWVITIFCDGFSIEGEFSDYKLLEDLIEDDEGIMGLEDGVTLSFHSEMFFINFRSCEIGLKFIKNWNITVNEKWDEDKIKEIEVGIESLRKVKEIVMKVKEGL